MDSLVLSVCTGEKLTKGRWSARGNEARTDAVGPVLVFAQIHVDAGTKVATEDVVDEHE